MNRVFRGLLSTAAIVVLVVPAISCLTLDQSYSYLNNGYYIDNAGLCVNAYVSREWGLFTIPEDSELPYPGLRGWYERVNASSNTWFFWANDRPTAGMSVLVRKCVIPRATNSVGQDLVSGICSAAESRGINDMVAFFSAQEKAWGKPVGLEVRRESFGSNEWLHAGFQVDDKRCGLPRRFDAYTYCCGITGLTQTDATVTVALEYFEMLPEAEKRFGKVYRQANNAILSSFHFTKRSLLK